MKGFLFKAKKGQMEFGSNYGYSLFKQNLQENEGKTYRIELLVSTRSLSQNALYWMFLEQIEIETGNNTDDLHEWAKRKFLKPKMIKVNGEEMKIPGSTTDLNKIQFSDYMDKIASEVGVAIPDSERHLREQDLAPLKS